MKIFAKTDDFVREQCYEAHFCQFWIKIILKSATNTEKGDLGQLSRAIAPVAGRIIQQLVSNLYKTDEIMQVDMII